MKQLRFVVVVLLLVAPMAFATEIDRSVWSETPEGQRERTPWTIFGGVGAGYGQVIGEEYRSAPGGGLVAFSGLLSLKTYHWVADAGLGWMYSSINGEDSLGRAIRIRTRSGLVELSPRYRLGERWQIGPVLQIIFGADTAFGPSVGTSLGTPLAGLKLAYEIPARFPVRLHAQAMTDLSIAGRQMRVASTGVQIGFPIHASRKSQEVDRIETPPQSAPDRGERVHIVLDPQQVFFGTNSSKLRPEVASVLAEIGDHLEVNPTGWSAVEVQGHADRRGRYEYNLKLSRRRADSVRSSFGMRSSEQRRIQSQGFSYSKPLDPAQNPIAWSKNRRVEITFFDVRDAASLKKIIDRLPKGMTSP